MNLKNKDNPKNKDTLKIRDDLNMILLQIRGALFSLSPFNPIPHGGRFSLHSMGGGQFDPHLFNSF